MTDQAVKRETAKVSLWVKAQTVLMAATSLSEQAQSARTAKSKSNFFILLPPLF